VGAHRDADCGPGEPAPARLIADRLNKRWGQSVVVENRPGGNGLVAISAFVSANDDHVLLSSPTSSFTAHPFVYKNVPYKPSDLQPIVRVSNTIIVIAVPADLPVKSMSELIALARAEPGKLNSAGPGPHRGPHAVAADTAQPAEQCLQVHQTG
jgi:tripartite-type tricarboxylate transporter receptor subunit TctC